MIMPQQVGQQLVAKQLVTSDSTQSMVWPHSWQMKMPATFSWSDCSDSEVIISSCNPVVYLDEMVI
jgi:hypothetical protein